MAARASWKGFLKVGELTCPVALYTAASTSERIAFHTLNRATGNRVRREFVDQVTGEPVEREAQVKGYETAKDEHIVLTPEEVAAAVPESDKTLTVDAFIPCGEIDTSYFDRPYFLAPDGAVAAEPFALIRDGMERKAVAALATTVLFRRVRTVLVRPFEAGMIATTLNFDYEVRSATEAFADIPTIKIDGEMLELAEHIIKTKRGRFDAAAFDDRYEAALAELVKAKLEGKKIAPRKPATTGKVIDLMEALRQSAGKGVGDPPAATRAKAGGAKKETAAKAKATRSDGKAASPAPKDTATADKRSSGSGKAPAGRASSSARRKAG
jgi:DNA end-binding protein Ku